MSDTPSLISREARTSQPARRPARRRLSASHYLIAAVVVLAFVLNLVALQDRNATTLVAVADGPVSAGSTFLGDSVRLVPVASDFEGLSSMITESGLIDIDGWVVQRSIPDGGVLDRSMFAAPGAPFGLRSMSVPVPVEHAAGGTLSSGDRVDVISVIDGVAHFVAVDVEVVGVAEGSGGSIGALGSYHLVLAVNASQALRLAEAIDAGSVEVVRSTGAAAIQGDARPDGS